MASAPASVAEHWQAIQGLPANCNKNLYKRQCISEFMKADCGWGGSFFEQLKEVYEDRFEQDEGQWMSWHKFCQEEGEQGAQEMVDSGTIETRPHKSRPAPALQYRVVTEKDVSRTGTKQTAARKTQAKGTQEQHEVFNDAFNLTHTKAAYGGGAQRFKRPPKEPIQKTEADNVRLEVKKGEKVIAGIMAKITESLDKCEGNPYTTKFAKDMKQLFRGAKTLHDHFEKTITGDIGEDDFEGSTKLYVAE